MATNFFVRKDTAGNYRWIGSHTNSFEDLDGDILTAAAHIKFADDVESGLYPLPPLYLCHESKWKIGEADLMVVDEVSPGIVFVITSGLFSDGMDSVAESLSKVPVTMSHGLHVLESSEFKGMRAIDAYHTVEISALPDGVALPANPRTYYVVEDQMGITNETRRDKLAKLLGIQTVQDIEAANAGIAMKAVDDTVVFKDAENDDTVGEEAVDEGAAIVEQVDEPVVVTDEVVEGEAADVVSPQYVTASDFEDFAALVGGMIKDFRDEVVATMSTATSAMDERMASSEAALKSANDELAQVKKDRDTPLAARPGYESLMKSILGNDGDLKTGDEAEPVKEEKARKTPVANGAIGLVYAMMEE